MRWTAGQREAILARNDSVLVSAAAGSGKTAVLVERVLSLLKEGMRIDRMLIVTFTRAAAGEMRERIGRRLEEEGAGDAHLRRQAMRLGRAGICTLHVFCARVLREHFQAAGIDPMCRVADEDKLESLRRRALDDVLEAAYADPTEDERALFDQFEDGQITEMAEQMYPFLISKADPWGWAEDMCAPARAEAAHWRPLLEEMCLSKLAGARELLPEMEKIVNRGDGPARYGANLEADIALTAALIREAEAGVLAGGKTAFGRLSTKKAGPGENPEAAERFKELRAEWKARIEEARGLLPADMEQAENDIRHTLPALRALVGLVRRMDEAYFAEKQKRNYLDYGDLEHLTLRALADPGVRVAVAGNYDALFIDEYQDVSGIQEAILTALHQGQKNLLFMVGDVKQSIYRFRLADPTLFLSKFRDYSLDPGAEKRKILLQQNFRSDENVLTAVNEVFSHAMREKETEIAYDETAMLRPGGGQGRGAPVEIHVLTAREGEDGEAGEIKKGYLYEAEFAARRILELMRTAVVREGNGTRPLRFRDIALLVRYASGRAPHIARVLQAHGIPVYSDADARFFDLPEVIDLMNLLQVIDNPLQDIPLLSALRCPCFEFTEEDLARIRLVERRPGEAFHEAFLAVLEKTDALGQKARRAWEQMSEWRFLARNLPVDQLVYRVLEESGLYMRSGAMPDGDQRQANLRLLAERARGESAREGLGAFLRETGRLRAGDDGKSAKTLGENEDVVRILTLHKSKGLEFPVVFLMELARPFRKGGDGLLRLHPEQGMALPCIEAEKRTVKETCYRTALAALGEKEARAEEARLLYVGMTRARERLILLGSPKRLDALRARWQRPATAYAAGSADSMLDWVMQSLGGLREGQFIGKWGGVWRMDLCPAEELTAREAGDGRALQPAGGEADEQTVRRLSRVIPPQPPLKTSVTAVAKRLREEKDDWESPSDKRRLPEETVKPDFLIQEEGLTAAQRGTVTHRVLGLVDYGLVRQGKWAEAVGELEKKGLLTPAERSAVRDAWLRGFFRSDTGRRALAAGEVRREWAFNLRGEKQTLIQGVIDLCFLEEDGWVLVDYKTDRADGPELIARYGGQMRWYARALREITGRPVKEGLLFGLRAGEAYPVAVSEP